MTDRTAREMLTFRKKPVVIEAFQMTRERRQDNSEWPDWMHDAWNENPGCQGSLQPSDYPNSDGTDELEIVTLEGTFRVSWGDWIIRGVKGEIYPCKPDIFAESYEPTKALQSTAASPPLSSFLSSFEDVLRGLASYVGAGGHNAETVDPDVFDRKIRWGIDHLVNATIQMCADIVEEQSKNYPKATWGSIKSAILSRKETSGKEALQSTAPSPDDIAAIIIRDVAELPDRTSPDDWPEAMLVTADELDLIVRNALQSSDSAALEDSQQ